MRWRRKDGSIRPHSGQHHAHSEKSGQPIYHEDDDEHCIHLKFHGVGRMWPRKQLGGIQVQGRDKDHHGGIGHRHGKGS